MAAGIIQPDAMTTVKKGLEAGKSGGQAGGDDFAERHLGEAKQALFHVFVEAAGHSVTNERP
jgi:hypothetical protein